VHHIVRLFNLSEDELQARILLPWVQQTAIELEDRRWVADAKTRLTIYEGPEIPTAERSMGRGWTTAQRDGEDVTEKLLATAKQGATAATPEAAAASDFKGELIAAASERPLTLHEVVLMTGRRALGWRASQRLALAENAVWELLHQRRLTMTRGEDPVSAEEWQLVLLNWEMWADPDPRVRLRAAEPAASGGG
jgi:hypothetical protein